MNAATAGAHPATCPVPVPTAKVPTMLTKEELELGRRQMLILMSAWSEDTYCAGWLVGLEDRLRQQGGVWEVLGRTYGWPVDGCGPPDDVVWTTWDEAQGGHDAD